IASSDNFWSMGDTGPCGPCSEIFYDHGPHLAGGPPGSAVPEGDRFVEIWNLVFMQFDQVAPGRRVPLPRPSIDTGMGIERVAAVLQGKHDNFDTDVLRSLILASAEATGTAADGAQAVSHRVIADHVRAVSFLMADGVMPANEGRGYVLRRIMRRAMRHAHLIGCTEPLLWRLVPALVAAMGVVYPELGRAAALITDTLCREESRFKEMLGRGLRLLDDEIAHLAPGAPLSGAVVFRLYDTYGFPLDLTQDALRGRGIGVDLAGFDQAMARQREEARAAWAGSGAAATEAIWFAIREQAGATEFLGYETEVAEAKVLALVVAGAAVDAAAPGTAVAVVVNQTPFYAEAGGQVGDSGVLFASNGTEVAMRDCQKRADALFVHEGVVSSGTLRVGAVVELRVDGARRAALRAHHSATHLLHAALRRRLGPHVSQKGSLVEPERLRFDISHPLPLSTADIGDVEAAVNEQIRANTPVETQLMTPEEAVAAGAIALFGEKYGEEVRVLALGRDDGRPYSIELCGGTHVRRTGDIGAFFIIGESALAAGVRRIEAVAGGAAVAHAAGRDRLLRAAAETLRVSAAELPDRIEALLEERRRLERDLQQARRALASGGGTQAAADVTRPIPGGGRFLGRRVDGVPPRELKALVDDLKRSGSGVYAVIGIAEGKASLVVGVTEDLTARFSAVELLRHGVAKLGGSGGGGRPDMAQGGGPDAAAAAAAFTAIGDALVADRPV
ncbi:MAG: alanine--tRNA ligase, partial [Alphaproteobacteria bacterium]|nr:alanine--tRNA ligase [Alphaproteobacteria bacterium]